MDEVHIRISFKVSFYQLRSRLGNTIINWIYVAALCRIKKNGWTNSFLKNVVINCLYIMSLLYIFLGLFPLINNLKIFPAKEIKFMSKFFFFLTMWFLCLSEGYYLETQVGGEAAIWSSQSLFQKLLPNFLEGL